MAKYLTRLRAYRLDNPGSSFSYAVDQDFTLIEARYNEVNRPSILSEMRVMGCDHITTLHITSWDRDHCVSTELVNILNDLQPTIIEYPGYSPDTDNGVKSLKLIKGYGQNKNYARIAAASPQSISALNPAEERKLTNIFYGPSEIGENHNDNSTIKFFRRGRFTCLSVGDCENSEIAEAIMRDAIIQNEMDVLILPHHGADNGFTSEEFLRKSKPRFTICTSNYDNPYEHPAQSVRNMHNYLGLKYYTTKTGDVVVVCGEDNRMKVFNLVSGNNKVGAIDEYDPKLIINW